MSGITGTEYKHIIEDLAKKHNLPEHVVERIVSFQFKFLTEVMRRRINESVWIQNLGTFKVQKVKYWMDIHDRLFDIREQYPEAMKNIPFDATKTGLYRDYGLKERASLRMRMQNVSLGIRQLLLDSEKRKKQRRLKN